MVTSAMARTLTVGDVHRRGSATLWPDYRDGVPSQLLSPTLSGRWVVLSPLGLEHVDGLVDAASTDRSNFGHTVVPEGRQAMTAYVEALLGERVAGRAVPFAQLDASTGEPVGCTRLFEFQWWSGGDVPDELEIGGTWLSATAQRTGVNTEAKYLLLRHAFDTLDVWRVAVCTDAENLRSRAAIERIGATFEGVLRQHRAKADSFPPRARDTAVYSIVRDEWPRVRAALETRLDR